ncbi:MAG: pilus assembly protein, partial [Granulosicoccaceae bacterium]
SLANGYDLDGDGVADPQTVKVYPIGMEIQQALLDDAAAASGTESYYASNAVEFENAFVEILANIKASGGVSMITATSSSDRFSKTSDREFLYYGQFVPSNNYQWQGNLKKYRYAYDQYGAAYITDTDTTNNPDITAADGSLISSAQSYWSDSADGNEALEGGVLDRLKSMGSSRTIRGINSSADIGVDIITNANILSTSNTFYNTQVNANDRSSTERQDIVEYAMGEDVHDQDGDGNTSEQRGHIGGIVRSSPVAIQFGGTSSNPDVVVFATTTDGVLHAFDDETGDELWAVVMPEAYEHLAAQHDNYFSPSPWWGIDGAITPKIIDENANGIIDGNDKVYLFVSGGMSLRRWFLYDVTHAESNQVELVRRGKFDTNDANWDELGLAISKAAPIVYRLAGDNTSVRRHGLFYPNGWDPLAEFDYLTPNTMGRGLSLYDLETGSPLWKMSFNNGNSDMKYAFATEPTTVDLNGDGYTDLIYAVDVNARVWRFNVDQNATSAANLIDGDMLAKLGTDSSDISQQRRTYRRIDAAAINTGGGVEVLLAIGTGDRMNPTSTSTQNRLHVIRDKTAGSGVDPTLVLTESNFYDATDNDLGEGSTSDQATAQTALDSSDGWYIDLPADQKAISAPLISSGIANFAVYQVGGTASNPCEDNNMGNGLLYRVNVLNATPVTDMDGSGGLSKNDRFTSIRGGGIPGDVGFHTSSAGIKTIIVNRDTFVNNPDEFNPDRPQTPEDAFHGDSAGYWFENERP